MRSRTWLIGTLASAPTPVLAHATTEPGFVWAFEPLVLVLLCGAAIWYTVGLIRLKQETRAIVIGRWNVRSFVAGMVVLFLALVSPIDTLGSQLFSVHMVQHLLLMLLAAPLMVLARPALAFVWATPPRRRKTIGRIWNGGRFSRIVEFLMQPLLVWLIFVGVFIFWHVPAPYAWALHNDAVHDLEHLTFFVASLMFWTIVFEPSGRRRIDYGATLLFVATTAVFSGLPGALMILTDQPIYTAHAATVGSWGFTLVEDQQLAGLIMWIPAGFVYVAAVCWLFLRWIDRDDAVSPATIPPPFRIPQITLACALCLLIAGCGDSAETPAERGQKIIAHTGCGTCHTIPGVAGAAGTVGPPLNGFARRAYIAGMLRNTPSNLERWLKDPQAIVPGNVMPDTGLTDEQAADAAAYLQTLR